MVAPESLSCLTFSFFFMYSSETIHCCIVLSLSCFSLYIYINYQSPFTLQIITIIIMITTIIILTQ
ncbi:hypothetical protein BJ944DRAFT_274302 [Cunninghamella echinulata]|nr:hypothetical protein BJ944DRAFT_274302 [Cunninghamella echinulata]